MLTAPQTTEILTLKQQALSALTQFAHVEENDGVPTINSTDDFELCKAIFQNRKFTGEYAVLKEGDTVKASGISNWEAIFIRLKDENGEYPFSLLSLRLVENGSIRKPQTCCCGFAAPCS